LSRILNKRVRRCDPVPPKRHLAIISWSGMRGVVSLAAALALPRTLRDGSEFPERDLIIFLSFAAILATLVVQGLTLPFLIRRFGVRDAIDTQHERQVRLKLVHAALSDLSKVAQEDRVNESALKEVTGFYLERVEALTDEQAEVLGWSDHREKLISMRQLRRKALRAERRQLLHLRKKNEVHDELMRRLEHEIDLEELRLNA
jgi:monovalent cation/hydrogen antiporter